MSETRLAALASQVKPAFMLPAAGMSVFGATLASQVSAPVAALHLWCVILALFVAHLCDEYIDAHVRREEPPAVGCTLLRVSIPLGTVAFVCSLGALWLLTDPLTEVLTMIPWILGMLHAPLLDRQPVAVSIDYAVAIGFVILGGYHAQTSVLPGWLLVVSLAVGCLLVGATISLDRLDRRFDATIGKRTLPVVLGDEVAGQVAAGCVAVGGLVLVVGAIANVLSPLVALPAAIAFVTALTTRKASGTVAIRRQMAGTYPFVGGLFVTLCVSGGCLFV